MGRETYEESYVMTMPTFYSSSGCRFYKSKSSVSCHVLWAELVDVQQQMNHVLFLPWTPLLGGFLAVTRVAVPAGQQQQGGPWAKEGCDEQGLCKPRHNKRLHPTGTHKHTDTADVR